VHYLVHGRAPGSAGSYSTFFFTQAFRSFHFQQNLDSRLEVAGARPCIDQARSCLSHNHGHELTMNGTLWRRPRKRLEHGRARHAHGRALTNFTSTPLCTACAPEEQLKHDRARSEHGRACDLFFVNSSWKRVFSMYFSSMVCLGCKITKTTI